MKRPSDLREALAAAFSALVGATVAVSLAAAHWTTPVKPRRVLQVSSALRVVARAPTAPAPTLAPVLVPIQTKEAPKAPAKAKTPPPEPAKAKAEPTPAAERPIIEGSKSTPMVQPDLPPTVTSNDDDLPRLPQAAAVNQPGVGKPPAPPDDYVPPENKYPEQPGGDTLVLGVLVDGTGRVLDTKILVPSRNAFEDLTYAIVASKTERFENVQLQPGETTRWLELRYVYSKNSMLP